MALMQLPPDFKEFLQLLNDQQVEYLLIGGYAVASYGYPRATGDIDFWFALDPANADKVVAVLHAFGFGASGLKRNTTSELMPLRGAAKRRRSASQHTA